MWRHALSYKLTAFLPSVDEFLPDCTASYLRRCYCSLPSPWQLPICIIQGDHKICTYCKMAVSHKLNDTLPQFVNPFKAHKLSYLNLGPLDFAHTSATCWAQTLTLFSQNSTETTAGLSRICCFNCLGRHSCSSAVFHKEKWGRLARGFAEAFR
jgi:hypothetical protein